MFIYKVNICNSKKHKTLHPKPDSVYVIINKSHHFSFSLSGTRRVPTADKIR